MREILFRGKNYDGEWIEGFFVHQGRCYEIYHKDYEEFLSQLQLTVTNSTGTVMFDAPASSTKGLTDWTYLGTLYSGGKADLAVVLKVPVELDNFVTISYDGYDTEGTAKAHFDKKAFVADYGEQVEDINGLIADCIDGSLSVDEGLSNGDTVVYQWDVDAETAESNYKAVLNYSDIVDTVSGLEELPDTTGMIFPDSTDVRLNNSDIADMDMDELRSALNEIYARHGYIFHNEKYQKEFESYSWYEPTIDADDWDGDAELNRIEKYNVEFLKNAIKELKEKAA